MTGSSTPAASPARQRWDWSHVWGRLSTWLAIAAASATSGLGAYALMPERAQALFPDWALVALGAVAVGAAIGVPVATSFRQRGLEAKP